MKSSDKKELDKYLQKGLKDYKPTTKEESKKLKRQYKSLSKRHKSTSLKLYHAKQRLTKSKNFFEQEKIKRNVIKLAQKKGDMFKDRREVSNKLNNKYTIETNNVDLNIKAEYLKRLKNPSDYIERLYENKTKNQIIKLTKSGKSDQAIGLIKLLEKSKPKHVDTKYLTQNLDQIEGIKLAEIGSLEDYIDEIDEKKDDYDLILYSDIDDYDLQITFI